MIQMDNRLERYERVQDAEQEAYLREPDGSFPMSGAGFWRNERILLMREISKIEQHLANNECDEIVTAEDWNRWLVECRIQLRNVEAQLEGLGVAN